MKDKLIHAVKLIVSLGKKAVFAAGVFSICYAGLKIWSSVKDEKELKEILKK